MFNAETFVSPLLFCALGSPTAVEVAAGWPAAGVPGVRWSPEDFAVVPVGFAVLPLGVLVIIYVIIFDINIALMCGFQSCVLFSNVWSIFVYSVFHDARRLRCIALGLCCVARRLRCSALRLCCMTN